MSGRLARCLVAVLAASACAGGTATGTRQPAPARPHAQASALPAPTPTPALPPYAIESLRARPYPGGGLQVGARTGGGPGWSKHGLTWVSGGQTMTGTISLPDGPGPFPLVVVEHGYIAPDRYWVGQDSGIFGDPMAAHGFIAVAPNWPGYAGSGPAPPGLPQIAGQLVTALDLVSSLAALPQADLGHVAFVGHSNGGGIALLAMVVDPRVRAVVLQAPVSSDMADNARTWWVQRPDSLGDLGTPDANPEGYAHLSPRNYFAAGQAPVLIVQGTADHTIPAAWTDATYAALQQRGVASELSWVSGGDHDLVGANLAAAVAAQEAWIRQTFHM